MAPDDHPVPPLRVLIVEDVPEDVELSLREFKRAGLKAIHRVVENAATMREALADFDPDIILSDFSLPHFDGLSALALARECAPHVPFIFVSGTVGEDSAIHALQSGASDYVLKQNLRRLSSAVTRSVQEARAQRAQRRTEAALTETRGRLQDIFNTLPDVLWSMAMPGERFDFMSPACESVYGRPVRDFEDDPTLWVDVIHGADRERVLDLWAQALDGASYDCEYRINRPDGSVRWVHARATVIRDETGRKIRCHGLVRDITAMMRDRLRLARLAGVHALLADANAAIVRVRRAADLMQTVVAHAARVSGIAGASATIFDATRGLVQFTVQAGVTPHPAEVSDIHAQSLRQSAASALAVRLDGGNRVWNDETDDPPAPDRALLAKAGIRSRASFSLSDDGVVVGELVMYARESDFFDPAIAGLLQDVAGNLSLALQLISKQNEADYLALYDPLTGLPNRNLLQSRLHQFVGTAEDAGEKLALVLFDVERFRDVNLLGGQQAGDELLRIVANRLRAIGGDETRVARLAGDHFALIVNGLSDATTLPGLIFGDGMGLQEVRHVVAGREIKVGLRAGVAIYPVDGIDADAIFRSAETALGEAHATGTRIAYCSAQIKAAIAERLAIEHRIKDALENNHFILHFQPTCELATGRIVGVEGLLRIDDPVEGIIPPHRFIGMLEESGQIERVGRWVMEEALRAQALWRHALGNAPRVAVNVSAVQLLQPTFVETVKAVLAAAGEHAKLELEITETVLIDDLARSVNTLRALRTLGVRIALDDFGTGYSSLRYLSAMPLDTVKIDRTFIMNVNTSPENAGIANAILALADTLHLDVVAEGVETADQAAWLREHGCTVAQGYLYSKPVSAQAFGELWKADQARG